MTTKTGEVDDFGPGLALQAVLENHKNDDKVVLGLIEKALSLAPK